MREYSHYINLGGLPHPLLVVKFWAELLDHQDGAEDNHPSLSTSYHQTRCEQVPQSSCHHSFPPITNCTWIFEPKHVLASWITSVRMISHFDRKVTKTLGIPGFYFFRYFPFSVSSWCHVISDACSGRRGLCKVLSDEDEGKGGCGHCPDRDIFKTYLS